MTQTANIGGAVVSQHNSVRALPRRSEIIEYLRRASTLIFALLNFLFLQRKAETRNGFTELRLFLINKESKLNIALDATY